MACSAAPEHFLALVTPRFSALHKDRYDIKGNSTTSHSVITSAPIMPDQILKVDGENSGLLEAEDMMYPVPMVSVCPMKVSNGSQHSEELRNDYFSLKTDELNTVGIRNGYLCLETDEFEAAGIQDNNIDPQITPENITDIVEMESAYYSGSFISFSSLNDEYNDTTDLKSFNEIIDGIEPENSQHPVFILNGTESQSNNFPLAIANIYREKISPTILDNETITECGEVNNLSLPQINITKHESIHLQMLCFNNETIKSSHPPRRGSKHLEGLQNLTMMLKQPSKLSIVSDDSKTLQGGVVSYVMQVTKNITLPQLHLLIKENLHIMFNTGYSLFRKYVLHISNESENEDVTEYLLTSALESITIGSLHQLVNWFVIIVGGS